MEDADLVVVGAGLYGITATITYHHLHPTSRLLLLESSPSVGGPWAPHRIFPGLKTNNLWGTYENPDFPMTEEKFGVRKGEHVPAENVTAYMRAIVDENDISGCVRLNTRVEVVERAEEGWRLHCVSTDADTSHNRFIIKTAKLILAVGHANRPFIPQFPTSAKFVPRITHSIDFPAHFSNIVKRDPHTLVVGGGKSAWDIAYTCATQPSSSVTMLIRPSGNGPVWMSPPHVTPLGLWFEKLVFTRFVGFMSPCPWAETSGFEGWIRTFLHRTWLGKEIVRAFWGMLDDDAERLNRLDEHPETKKLKPWGKTFEAGNAPSILNYPTNFFDLVKDEKMKVIFDEVDVFEEGNKVLLKGGQRLEVDSVVFATGWETGGSMKFRPEGLEQELGLPGTGNAEPPNIDDRALVEKVEADLYAEFPFLKQRSPGSFSAARADDHINPRPHPYRLYRFLVPLSDLQRRSIGFAGTAMSLANPSCAYLQSIWLSAYLDGTLSLPTDDSLDLDRDLDQLKYDTYRDSQFCALRNVRSYGNKFPDLVFDSLPYFDLLLKDLGLREKRKGGSGGSFLGLTNWFAECFGSYGPGDYRGLLVEWERKVSEEGESEKKNV